MMASDYLVLERCLEEILSAIKPSESDRVKRSETFDRLAESISSIANLRGAVVQPFGSFVSNLYSINSDLDISVQLSEDLQSVLTKPQKINALTEISEALRTQGITADAVVIRDATVPVLAYVDNRSGISCDVSINNHSGLKNSKILYLINSLDQRFGDMVLLVKEWAKAQDINDAKDGTLNSYSLCLLVIFHFQTCKPPLLPPLYKIRKGYASTDMMFEDVWSKNSQPTNKSSLHELLVSFFNKFSQIKELSSEHAICTYSGRWEKMNKSGRMLVEDPFNRPQNAAKAVRLEGLDQISTAINEARRELSSAPILRNTLLHLLCRPSVFSKVIAATGRNHQQVRNTAYGRATPVYNHPQNQTTGYARGRPVHDQQECETTGYASRRAVRNNQGQTRGKAAARPVHNNHQFEPDHADTVANSYHQEGNHRTGNAGVDLETARADNVRGYASVAVPVALAAAGLFLIGRGIYNRSRDSG